jgi:hypothetical protein
MMSIAVDCPNGHTLKVKDKYAGKTGRCPYCRARVEVPDPSQVSDEDVLDYLSGPHARPQEQSLDESVFDDPSPADPEATGVSLAGSTTIRNKKFCPHCGKFVSLSFRYCPSCSTNLSGVPSSEPDADAAH